MKLKTLSGGLVALFLLFCFSGFSQVTKQIFYNYSEVSKADVAGLGTPQIIASNSKVFEIDAESIRQQMEGVAHREDENSGFIANISFPHPDGTMHAYTAMENSTMHPGLAAQFPEIRAYDAYDTEGTIVKWDITPHGLHAMIMQPGKSTIFIDPIVMGNTDYYIVYYKKDFSTDKVRECFFDSDQESMNTNKKPTTGSIKSFGSCELRTYRLALSATGEYTTFHGGTVALAQAAQVTTMNRVNGVYERDMSVTMVIIANNNLIVYTNSSTDPFTNGTPGTMINQNQTNTNTVIGSSNYDIGHVFGTNSGGLAGLGVVCNNSQKARGVTGSAAPVGDPFDIDYVAHEMGHQFGCNHTFAGTVGSCSGNGNLATAMEPGSGTTIMAYAGICGALNVQSNSDDHFHGISLQEMGNFVTGSGNSCPVSTSLSNNPPVILSTNGGVVVPAGTPFALTAVATDPDGDPLTYCWEQMDNAFTAATPSPTATSGPNFRSLSPMTSPTRYFPALPGTSTTWEMLPTVSRTMNFRVSVRDNSPGPGGCNDHQDITITTDAGSGPFIVTYPSATGITWVGLTSEIVTWDVANTDMAPVACSNVDILLSTDGGLTFPTVLASNVPNDGSQSVVVPNISTTTAVIMVICSNGTFFDVSDNNFTITMATYDYSLGSTPSSLTICQPSDAVFTVDVGSVGGYADPVTLSVSGVPAGATSNFSVNPVTPIGQSILTISNTAAAAPGAYTLTITANSTTGTKTTMVDLIISSGAPTAVSQTAPANGATGVSVPTTFTWTTAPEIGVTYEIDIATDPGFSSIVDQATGLTAASYVSSLLSSTTTYYWRVRSVTGCGSSSWSSAFSFTTNSCSVFTSTDIPQPVGAASVTSTLNVAAAGTLTDVNVSLLDISHAWVGDVRVTLTSPTGTVVELFNGPGIPASTYGCGGDDIYATFDDAAALTATDLENMCNATPPAISGDFQSTDLLSAFNGESMTGTWTLTVYDSYTASDNGTLNAWSLQLCTTPSCTDPSVPTISGTTTICPGASTTLSISSGALNDATAWEWYTGSCGGTPVGTGTSLTVSPVSATTYYVRGEGGCTTPGTCTSVTVTPEDVTAPTLSCPGNQTTTLNASCQATLSDYTGMASVSDACDASPAVSQSPAPGTTITSATTVTITATDASGNNTSCTFTVTPLDNTAPTLSCPGNQTETANGACQIVLPDYTGLASVSDACDASPAVMQSPAPGTTVTGATTVTLTATDVSGNNTSCTFTVTPTDNTPPTISCPGNQTTALNASCQATLSDYTGMASVSDACDASPTVSQLPAPGTTITAATTVTLTATDASGNNTSCTFTVTPVDNTAPILTCPGNQTETANGACQVVLPDYTGLASVSDACDASPVVTQSPAAGTTVTGAATVTLTATDASGNSTSCTFTVTPTDNTPPTISCPGNQTVDAGVSCQASLPDYTALASVSDVCDASPTVSQSPVAGTAITGVTTVTITATDASGNSSSCTFTVTPVDNTAPSIVCPGTQYVCSGTMPDFSTMTSVSDNCDVSPVLTQVPSSGTALSVGTTTVTMTVADASGNTSSCTFDVVVNSYNQTENVSICYGDVYTFPDGTTGTTTQTYTSMLTTTGGCDSIIVTNLTVDAQIDVSLSASGATLTVGASGATYQWIDCDNGNSLIAGATAQSYTPTVTGNYAAVVSVGNCSDTSACQLVDFTSLAELSSNSVNMYPNPAGDQVTIEWLGRVERIEITDAQGKLVQEVREPQGSSYHMELVRFSAGVYFVHVYSETGRTVLDLVKE